MNQEVKQKWVTALKSGEYKQGKFHLKNFGVEYCCLGVLCDLYRKENTGMNWEPSIDCFSFLGRDGSLSVEVQKWAGIDNSGGMYLDTSLVSTNDKGIPFTEIANIIEQNF